MLYKILLVIIVLGILVGVISYRYSNESNCYGFACSADSIIFQDTFGCNTENVEGNIRKISDFYIKINTGCAVELSNVLIEISLPKEVSIKPFFRPQPNENFDYVNNKVTRKIDKILHISYEILGVSVKYDTVKWRKPIEVFMSFDYKRTVDCPYPAYIDGRYTKRVYLLFNEKGRLEETSSSDKTWTYVGPSQ